MIGLAQNYVTNEIQVGILQFNPWDLILFYVKTPILEMYSNVILLNYRIYNLWSIERSVRGEYD